MGSAIFSGGALSLECNLFFLRPLALDRNDFKFASALSAIPLQRKLPLGAIPPHATDYREINKRYWYTQYWGGGGSVLGYSQANSSQPNSVHEYIHISEVRLYAELSKIAEN